jgi:hypothetical protein
MSKSNPQSTTKSPSKDNQPIPSKYTYADVSNFHRTTLAILRHKDLCTLRVPELTTILHFTFVIADLLDSAQIFNYSIKEHLQISNLSSSGYPSPRIQGLGVISKSKRCLHISVHKDNYMGKWIHTFCSVDKQNEEEDLFRLREEVDPNLDDLPDGDDILAMIEDTIDALLFSGYSTKQNVHWKSSILSMICFPITPAHSISTYPCCGFA